LGHGVLLVFRTPCQLRSLAGQEHGRTIPLADLPSFLLGASELPLANYFKIEIAGTTLKYDVGPTTASSAALAGTR